MTRRRTQIIAALGLLLFSFSVNLPCRRQRSDPAALDLKYRDLALEYVRINQRLGDRRVTVFFGDSITKRFPVQEYYMDKEIVNRGIYSDTTGGMLARMASNVNCLKADKLFILGGFNDLKHRSDEEIVTTIGSIVANAGAGKVYVQSLLPVFDQPKAYNARISKINEMLKKLCEETKCRYVDLHSVLLGQDGQLSREYSHDGIHPNAEGNQAWAAAIRRHMEEP